MFPALVFDLVTLEFQTLWYGSSEPSDSSKAIVWLPTNRGYACSKHLRIEFAEKLEETMDRIAAERQLHAGNQRRSQATRCQMRVGGCPECSRQRHSSLATHYALCHLRPHSSENITMTFGGICSIRPEMRINFGMVENLVAAPAVKASG